MKEDLPFDDFIKEQFSNYSPDVPSRIWENIVSKRRSRPKGFWTFGTKVLVGALLLTATGVYFIFKPSGQENKNIATSKTEALPTSQIPVKEQTAKDQTLKETTGKENSENKETSSISPVDQSNTQSSSIISNKQQPLQSVFSQNNIRSHSPALIPLNAADNVTNSTPNNAGKETAAEIKSPVTSSEQIGVVVNKITFPSIFNNARDLNTKTVSRIKMPDCPALEKNAAGNKKYWEVYAGPDYAFRNYKTLGDTASFNYLQKRKESTTFASAFSAGVRYTKVFDNGMSVRAGANYSQVNEKFIYFNPNEIKYITVITTRVVIRQPGDTIYINDTLQYQQTGTRTKTTYNRYHNIDIPIVIGYELGNGRVHANINAGVIINVYSWYKGDMLDSTYQPVSITTGKNNSVYQFKTNIGVGFLGSVSLYYKLNDQVHILIEPYFRYNLSPMSKENLNLQEKFHTVGLRAGVRFDLK